MIAARPRMGLAQLDMFGSVSVSWPEVYAWLLCVPRIDPASPQAPGYVRGYGVIEKIARAKVDGSFDGVLAQAMQSARFLQLLDTAAPPQALEELFNPRQAVQSKPLTRRALKAPNRPKAIIQAEKARQAAARKAKQTPDSSMLCRVPAGVPSLGHLLSDIGNPSPYYLAQAMHVPVEEAARWIAEDDAPRAVLLALFWLTRWGAQAIDAHAHNDAVHQAYLAAASRREADRLRCDLAHVEKLADFGSANDPLPTVQGRAPSEESPQAAASSEPAMLPAERGRVRCVA